MPRAGSGYRGGGHYGGGPRTSHSRFYFGASGYGYGYYGNGLRISVGLPAYSYYSYYGSRPYYIRPYYIQPYFLQPYYTNYPVPYVAEDAAVDATYAAPTTSTNGAVIPASGSAADFQLQAEQAFRGGRYEDAARLSNHAIVEDGQNGKLHLFASQTLFALGDYRSAAAAIQQAAALLDRSQWGFVVENYKKFYRGDDYVTQMAKLGEFIKENPDASYVYFLRGYHYKFLGYDEAARKQLAKAVELESRDRLAAELLAMAGGKVPDAAPNLPPDEELTVPGPTAKEPPAGAPDKKQ